jgi:hypothetical protein
MGLIITPLFFLYLSIFISSSLACSLDTTDRNQHDLALKITSRIHSGGFFYFGGKMAEYNPAIDINLTAESRSLGFVLFKAADLADIHSSFNFALAGVYKNIHPAPRLKLTPQFIALIEQPSRIVDEGSDVGVTITTAYKLNNFLTIEETMIFFNLIFETKHLDFINRIRLLYSRKNLDLALMGWHNNNLLDHASHGTAALSLGYNRVKISPRFSMGASIMASSTFISSDKEDVPERNGLIVSVIGVLM